MPGEKQGGDVQRAGTWKAEWRTLGKHTGGKYPETREHEKRRKKKERKAMILRKKVVV